MKEGYDWPIQVILTIGQSWTQRGEILSKGAFLISSISAFTRYLWNVVEISLEKTTVWKQELTSRMAYAPMCQWGSGYEMLWWDLCDIYNFLIILKDNKCRRMYQKNWIKYFINEFIANRYTQLIGKFLKPIWQILREFWAFFRIL